jgi:RimJ/RimL family protein N-acetyltransferase
MQTGVVTSTCLPTRSTLWKAYPFGMSSSHERSPNGITPVELTGRGVYLRPWRSEDAHAVTAARRHPAIVMWSPETARPDSVEMWLAIQMDWSTGRRASFAVVDAESDVLAGGARLYRIDWTSGEAQVGYWTMPTMFGRGIATRAVVSVTDWAFNELRLRRLELSHAIDNPASCRVAQRAGYSLHTTLETSYRYGDGQLYDEHLHVRVASQPDA